MDIWLCLVRREVAELKNRLLAGLFLGLVALIQFQRTDVRFHPEFIKGLHVLTYFIFLPAVTFISGQRLSQKGRPFQLSLPLTRFQLATTGLLADLGVALLSTTLIILPCSIQFTLNTNSFLKPGEALELTLTLVTIATVTLVAGQASTLAFQARSLQSTVDIVAWLVPVAIFFLTPNRWFNHPFLKAASLVIPPLFIVSFGIFAYYASWDAGTQPADIHRSFSRVMNSGLALLAVLIAVVNLGLI